MREGQQLQLYSFRLKQEAYGPVHLKKVFLININIFFTNTKYE